MSVEVAGERYFTENLVRERRGRKGEGKGKGGEEKADVRCKLELIVPAP